MISIRLPSMWELLLDADPMSGGVTYRAEMGRGTDNLLWLSLVAIPGKPVDAVLYWHTLPEPIKLQDGTTGKMADIHSAQVSGAATKAAAIRAVEEAAILAGWARKDDRPKRICLCGSTKFKRAYQEWNARLTLEGCVVLSVSILSHADRLNPSEEQKALLDRVHLAKIDACDEIFVLDVGGYVGSSTRNEIGHAERTGKPVRYLSREFPDWTEDDCRWWRGGDA